MRELQVCANGIKAWTTDWSERSNAVFQTAATLPSAIDSMRDAHSDDDDPGDACPTFMQPILPAISIVVTLAVPALFTTAAHLAHYSAASMTAAFLFPLVGVFSFLVAPLSVRRAELSEEDKEKESTM